MTAKLSPDGEQFGELYLALRLDVDALAGGVTHDGQVLYPDPARFEQATRRQLVRTIFAFIEGCTYRLKQSGLVRESHVATADGEYAIANEVSYDLNDAGEVVARAARLRFLPNIRFAFAFYGRAYGRTFHLPVDGAGWQSLRSSAHVRNRLMHPKDRQSVEVTDREVRDALHAFSFMNDQMEAILALSVVALSRSLKNDV
jgi:hypothetical protein